VPQHLLNRTQVRPALKKVRGEGMPQQVRFDLFLDARLQGVAFDHLPDRLPGEAPPQPADKHIIALFLPKHLPTALLEIKPDALDRLTAERHNPFLVALADTTQKPDIHVHRPGLEIDRLGNTHACGVKRLQYCLVSYAARPAQVRLRQQSFHFPHGKSIRYLLPEFRGIYQPRRVILKHPLPHQETVEHPYRRQPSRDGIGRYTARLLGRHKLHDIVARNPG